MNTGNSVKKDLQLFPKIMGVLQRVVKPRNQKSKKALEEREPKAIENTKIVRIYISYEWTNIKYSTFMVWI